MDVADSSGSDASDAGGWSDWEGDAEQAAVCLLCLATHTSVSDGLVPHMRELHGVDLREVVAAHKLDLYGAVRLVNLVRSDVAAGRVPTQTQLLARETGALLSKDDKLLVPVLADDAVLFRLADIVGDVLHEIDISNDNDVGNDTPTPDIARLSLNDDDDESVAALRLRVQRAEQRAAAAEQRATRAEEALAALRVAVHQRLDLADTNDTFTST